MKKIESFQLIGLKIRTTNQNGQAMKDIPLLWNKFLREDIQKKIPHKLNNEVICVYTAYEKDHTLPYSVVLGCKVSSLDVIPNGMHGLTIQAGNYKQFLAKGDLMGGAIANEWIKIWNSNLNRAFKTDFEVYGEKAQKLIHAEVEIYIGLK